ncbi:hypothetical protein BIY24_11950 [Halobacteriovorax marinus]|uniref:mannose-1-phosphate guanylyltransferase n=1 Tax=Halobacteriovorax marinus TaxID=97084 RepID=UPI000BC2F546|nr:mannose-1-phosphate guanylyltransferase [Halobacteriovorax marinus]ATH08632.1 hypothetical protein BIY24_11950 [Halobacteriovorax marinus]
MGNIYSLVMAGGQGTRFWPESTSKKPKQYLPLVSSQSLLADTLDRLDGLVKNEQRYIVTVKEQEKLVLKESAGKIGQDQVVFEPSGRNTAPCILLSLATLMKNGASKSDLVAILPSDHVILNKNGFQQTIQSALKVAVSQKRIITIGIPPHFPHTGFGYIQTGEELTESSLDVVTFKEKPNQETAISYLESGKYLWNAGMFVAEIGVLLEEFQAHCPEIFEFYDELYAALGNEKNVAEVYAKLPAESIDYAIMEKSSRIGLCKANFDWNDLGSWDALSTVVEETEGNTLVSAKNHYFEDSKGNIVYTPDQFVGLIGIEDLIVIANGKSVVVLPKKDSQKVKNIVSHLKDQEYGKELL